MKCPGCGSHNPDQAAVCRSCATALDRAAEQPTAAGGAESTSAPTVAADALPHAPTAGALDASAAETVVPGETAGQGPRSLAPGERLGERYEILSVLGEGGMGAVYKAHDRVLDRTVAIKAIHPGLAGNAAMLERFKREILLASKITHKNVVRIHDLGEIGDLKFISMNFVEGQDLKEIILEQGPFALERAVPLIRQMGEALQAAHDAGVVHRDLKPQNVLVDVEDNAYIADFGISRSIEHGKTMTEAGSMIGTLAYMSPEQARGETLDHRSDVYSFGLIMYEMLTGSLPFESDNALSSLMRRAQEDVPPVDATRSGMPTWIVRIVSRAVARDADDRYQSVTEILKDLERQRASITVRRKLRTRLVQAAAGLAVAAALLAGVTAWVRNREPAGPPPIRAELILVPFRNLTSDPRFDWAGAGLPQLLRTDLQQFPSLRLVGEDRVRQIVDGLKLGRDGQFDSVAIQRIVNVVGVENVVSGDLFKIGERFRIDARLLRAGGSSTGQEVPIRVEGDGENALFGMIDELGARVRSELGLSRGWGKKHRGARELSTASVEALRLYTEGQELVREGRDLDAVRRLTEAVAVDSSFAMARASLAEAYMRLGQDDRALEEAGNAASGLSDVSPYELARINALRARLAGDAEAAGRAYAELCRLGPNRPEAFLELATFREETGDLEGASESMSRVLDLDESSPYAHYVLGRIQAKLGNTGEALQQFNTALALHLESGNDEGRATVLNGLGKVSEILGQFDNALRYFRESLTVREQIGDRRGQGVALNNIATVLDRMGRYDEAIETQKRSIVTYEELGDDVGLAGAWSNLGTIYDRASRTSDALSAFEKSLDIVRDGGDEDSIARAFGDIGYIYTVLGDYNQAFFFLKDALRKRRELGDQGNLSTALLDIGIVEQVQGRYEQAIEYYAEGLEHAREMGDQATVAALSVNLAGIHREQGNYGAALSLLAEAEATARRIGARNLLVACLRNKADTLRLVGHAGADAALEESLALAREIGSRALEAEVLTSRGQLLLAQGRREDAAAVLGQAVAAAEDSRDRRLLLAARLRRAEAAGSTRELGAVLTEAKSSRLEPIIGPAHLALAHLREAADSLEDAEGAIRAAEKIRQLDVAFQAHHAAVRALSARGEAAAARQHGLDGLAHLEAMRKDLDGEPLASFLARPETVAFGRSLEPLLPNEGDGSPRARLSAALNP